MTRTDALLARGPQPLRQTPVAPTTRRSTSQTASVQRVLQAMLKMHKIEISERERAYTGTA